MTFLTEWYPEFLKDKKNSEGKVEQILNDTNKKMLMSFGITKDSKIEEIPMAEAKNSPDLILFRNKVPKDPKKVWIGYKFDNKFGIYRPSDIGAKSVFDKLDSEGKVIKGDTSYENLSKLYTTEQAFKITINPKSKAKAQFKKNDPDYSAPEKDKTLSNKLSTEAFKKSLLTIIDKSHADMIQRVKNWKENILGPLYVTNDVDASYDKEVKNFINILIAKRNKEGNNG